MGRTSLNLVSLMNYAWDRRTSDSAEYLQEQVRNLVSHAYVSIQKLAPDNGRVFIMFQHLFVFLIKADGEHLQGEYDAYCKFCEWAGYQPLKVEDVNSLYNRLSTNELVKDVNELKSYRDRIDGNEYQAMILGFCFLSLLGDKSFDENEYYVIRCFFDDDGYDYCPATWEQFKREW